MPMDDRCCAERRYANLLAIGLVTLAGAALLTPDGLVRVAPGCLWHQLGFPHCWGCGMTRACVALVHGHLVQALALNPRSVLVLPLASVAALRHVARTTQRNWLSLEPRRL